MTSMTVNGEAVRFQLDPATPLLWALRDAANLTGTKYGCDSQDCGACTVIVDEQAARSCAVSIGALEGADVVTIEGLAANRAHPVQRRGRARRRLPRCRTSAGAALAQGSGAPLIGRPWQWPLPAR